MTPEEVDDLNRRTAVALGWKAIRETERDVYRGSVVGFTTVPVTVGISPNAGGNAGMPREIPDFATGPSASKLIKQHIVAANHEYGSGYDYSSSNRDGGPYWAKVDRCNTESFGEFYVRCDGEESALALAFFMSEEFAKSGRRSCGWVDLRWCKRPGSPNGNFAWFLQIRNDDDIKRPVTFSRWAMDVFSLIGEGVHFIRNHPSPVLDA